MTGSLSTRGDIDAAELIDGLLVVAEPQSASHYTAIGLVARALTRAFGGGWTVRSQGPLALDETSEPEPDWVVLDLVSRTLEVRREPAPSASAPYGWDYASVRILTAGDSILALAAAEASIAVSDLLPPA